MSIKNIIKVPDNLLRKISEPVEKVGTNEKKLIQDYIKLLENNKVFNKKIVTQILPFEVFYYAEEYHQNYEKLNPYDPYVKNVSIPRINRFKNLYPELLKESFKK